MNILGIEGSCDETAAALVVDGREVRSSIVASQVDIHAAFGGVVPEVASRQHLLWIIPVIEQALAEAKAGWQDVDAIAVTKGPGLVGSLLVGLNAAKAVAFARQIPIVGINHIEGHIYGNWLIGKEPKFPLLCLVVSGGHSDLILMVDHGEYRLLGKTRDDAAGEAFDKAARILGLGYPGGPAIQRAAETGRAGAIRLPRAWLRNSYDFSFSGLKTAVWRMAEKLGLEGQGLSGDAVDARLASAAVTVGDVALSFQEAVVDVLVEKTRQAANEFGVETVLLAGGVASNAMLRARMSEALGMAVQFPPPKYCTDNAAMIASCGYFRLKAGYRDSVEMDAYPNLKLV
jgi:N6-L-threonylcarbamoyladenine synthase